MDKKTKKTKDVGCSIVQKVHREIMNLALRSENDFSFHFQILSGLVDREIPKWDKLIDKA